MTIVHGGIDGGYEGLLKAKDMRVYVLLRNLQDHFSNYFLGQLISNRNLFRYQKTILKICENG